MAISFDSITTFLFDYVTACAIRFNAILKRGE